MYTRKRLPEKCVYSCLAAIVAEGSTSDMLASAWAGAGGGAGTNMDFCEEKNSSS